MQKLKLWLGGAQPFMAIASTVFVVIFVALVFLNLELVGQLQGDAQRFVAQYFSGYLVWVVTVVMLITIAIAVSPYGRLRLGRDDERPEFNRFSWFAMLFSAGVGTGILFYGVAEPIFHLQANPYLALEGAMPRSAEAGVIAQRITLFHWGLHGWAIYSVVGLCLGYFSYRLGLPLSIRSALYPLLGDRIYGAIGNTIDLIAVLSTLFGIAVSLGLGASQMASGIEYLFGFAFSPIAKFALILFVAMVATLSAVSGVSRGIRRLSEINIFLSVVLIAFLILAGPTVIILSTFVFGTLDYVATFLPMGIWVDPDRASNWQGAWTIFYWGWWISWGPFVGMFMARVSRGRTIREYVAGTLLGPTLAGFLWLSVFGATALELELSGPGGLVEAVNQNMTQALYTTFELLQVEWATWSIAFVATTLILSWFVTSCDSGTLVICTIINAGKTHPPKGLRILWGTIIGLVAGLLLLAGGLGALQTASTAIAVPFSVVLLLMVFGLVKSLLQSN